MSTVTRSIALIAAMAILQAIPAAAQGTSALHWYIGGQGGAISFATPNQTRSFMPIAGAHLLVNAKRTGLLLSIDQGFDSRNISGYSFVVTDSTATPVSAGTVTSSFDGLRKYSAVLMAYPIRGRVVQPYLGLGGGILHTTQDSIGGAAASHLGSHGFATLLGGLEFRLGRFTAFGQYQIATAPSSRTLRTTLDQTHTLVEFGNITSGPTHTLEAGLRFDLGRARDETSGSGY